jgi:chromosome segregation ATPase
MRQWTLALLAAFALNALAQEGDQLLPRIPVPGERSVARELKVSDQEFKAWDLTTDDRKAVEKKIEDLNATRKDLIGELKAAQDNLTQARAAVSAAVTKLQQQEAELYAFVKPMLPEDKKATFDIRVELQPLIAWLDLTDDQARQLVGARRQLVGDYGGPGETPPERLTKAATEDVTPETRDQYKKLVADYMKFNKAWFDAVSQILTPEQRKVWETRFRRTRELIAPGVGF